ncbi:hypothetical protein BC629DRAFT_1634578 [Irpex lacteus]|nr:hypothetical protein BC629DRAFT_1634578 [Irpex lacteus]
MTEPRAVMAASDNAGYRTLCTLSYWDLVGIFSMVELLGWSHVTSAPSSPLKSGCHTSHSDRPLVTTLDKYYPLNHAGNGLMVVFVCVVYLNVSSFISGGFYAALQYVSTTATVNILVILGRSTLPEITTKAYKVHLPYKDVAGLFAATVYHPQLSGVTKPL